MAAALARRAVERKRVRWRAQYGSAATTNVHRAPRAPRRPLAALPTLRTPRYELWPAPCQEPPGSRDEPGNVRGHPTSVAVLTTLSCSDPAQALVAESRGAALVVVGSRGRGHVRGTLLGSVSQAVVAHAHCPIAVVHHRCGTAERPAGMQPGLASRASPAGRISRVGTRSVRPSRSRIDHRARREPTATGRTRCEDRPDGGRTEQRT
ncbi:universal stress protein [Pseudonocardia sp. GCM10023141]|uniref:universal stress protein n=1 Tax=Pseudonocardia sp. GCM10023141 TaxID=3252653 RepID=UPI00360D543B